MRGETTLVGSVFTHGKLLFAHFPQYPYFNKKLNETIQPLNLAKNDEDVEESFEDVFRDCWYSTFLPTEPIQERIAEEMVTLGLRRNQYQALHIRSQYHGKAEGRLLFTLTRNALQCMFMLDPEKAESTPVYVSADHRSAIWATLQYARNNEHNNVIARDGESLLKLTRAEVEAETSTLHMDRGNRLLARNPSETNADEFEAPEFYDTFVDLYIMSQADCIARCVIFERILVR